MKSILSKFLAVIISGLLVMTVVIGSISLFTTNKLLHKDADVILDLLCEKEASLINNTLDNIKESVHIMENYALSEVSSVNDIKNQQFLDEYTENVKQMFTNVAKNTEGVVAYYYRFNPEITLPTAGFFVSLDDNCNHFIDYPTTDFSKYSPDDDSHVGWYYKPAKAGRAIWLEPYHNLNNGLLMISYVIPLYIDNQLIGVIGMDIDFSVITETVNEISVYDSGCATIMSSDEKTVYNKDTVLKTENEYAENWFTESVCELQNGMKLKVKANYEDIQKESYPMIHSILIACVLVLLVFVLYTLLVSRRITKPLIRLTVAAQHLADGKADAPLECNTKDEVAVLTRVFNQTSEKLKEYMSYINALAYRDSLTGIRNRTAYDEAAAEMDRRINISVPDFAVLVADVNDLKRVNDSYGHDMGNELIIHASKFICETFKHSPVFRIGGDEFVVILENNDFKNYRKLLEKLDALCLENEIPISGDRVNISIACGVAIFNPENDKVFEDVFNKADKAMYLNKQAYKEKHK